MELVLRNNQLNLDSLAILQDCYQTPVYLMKLLYLVGLLDLEEGEIQSLFLQLNLAIWDWHFVLKVNSFAGCEVTSVNLQDLV